MASGRLLGIALVCAGALACSGEQGGGPGEDDRFDDTSDLELVVTARDAPVTATLGEFTVASSLSQADQVVTIETDELIYAVEKATVVSLDAPVERAFQVEIRESEQAEWNSLRPEAAGETWSWTELTIHKSYGQFQFIGSGAPYGGLAAVVHDVQIAKDVAGVQMRVLAIPAPGAPGDYETVVTFSRLSL
jgi:hypothetical protein